LSEGGSGGLADGHDVVFGEDVVIHLAEILGEVGTVGVGVGRVLELFGREIGQTGGLGDERDDVHAESVDAFVEPEAHEAVDLFANLRVRPVEIGLLGREVVEVILVRLRVERPRGTGEIGGVVVGRGAGAIGRGVSGLPDVEVAIWIGLAVARFDEPLVLVRRVVDDEIDDEAHVALLGAGEKRVEVGDVAELGHYLTVVADVVATIDVGRVEVRTEPDDVDAELLQIVKLRGDARQVSDTIAVRVFEGAWVDLVDDRFLPPLRLVTVDELGFLAESRRKC